MTTLEERISAMLHARANSTAITDCLEEIHGSDSLLINLGDDPDIATSRRRPLLTAAAVCVIGLLAGAVALAKNQNSNTDVAAPGTGAPATTEPLTAIGGDGASWPEEFVTYKWRLTEVEVLEAEHSVGKATLRFITDESGPAIFVDDGCNLIWIGGKWDSGVYVSDGTKGETLDQLCSFSTRMQDMFVVAGRPLEFVVESDGRLKVSDAIGTMGRVLWLEREDLPPPKPPNVPATAGPSTTPPPATEAPS